MGGRVPAHCSGMGKAILAFLDPHAARRILPKRLTAHTGHTIVDRQAMLAELGLIRRRGYAVDEEEFMDGVRCVAVPVWGRGQDVAGAISLAGPAFRLTGAVARGQVEPLREAATRISRLISADAGYSSP